MTADDYTYISEDDDLDAMRDADCDDAIHTARKWLESNPLFLDTETTDLNGEICEIAILDREGKPLLDSLIKPYGEFSQGAIDVHGITPAMCAQAPTFAELWEQIRALLAGRVVIIYNASFDRGVLRNSAWKGDGTKGELYDNVDRLTASYFFAPDRPADAPRWKCAMKLFAKFYGAWSDYYQNYRWQTLQSAAACFRLPPQNHRARGDAELCRQIIFHIALEQTTAEKLSKETTT